MPYRKLIVKAVEELRDSNMKSSHDAIYRFVESHIPDGIECNYPLFLTNIKAMAEDGILELTSTHCSLSTDYKRKRIADIQGRAQYLQRSCPDVKFWMNDTSAEGESWHPNMDHIKHKEAIRRAASALKHPRNDEIGGHRRMDAVNLSD